MFSIRIPVFGFFFSEAAAGSELEAAGEVEEQNLTEALEEEVLRTEQQLGEVRRRRLFILTAVECSMAALISLVEVNQAI